VVTRRSITIASRGSQLALWQTERARSLLTAAHPELDVAVEIIRTTGDRILDVPLARIGDRGLFTKELDEALLDGRADLAVHSLKDVPTSLPQGLILAAISDREDPRDVLIGPSGRATSLGSLPGGARVGTSSLRRRSQLRALRPDLEVVDLRGNLNTRLSKLDAGEYEAIILAAAGVVRLGWSERVSQYLPVEDWLPAVGQGALAVVGRTDDASIVDLIRTIHHPATAANVTAERGFLRALEGGCQVPIGALATSTDGVLTLQGMVADMDGLTILREVAHGPVEDAPGIGARLAERLIALGADVILRQVRSASGAPGIPAP
jgi:hydroxymethylbilane synthase